MPGLTGFTAMTGLNAVHGWGIGSRYYVDDVLGNDGWDGRSPDRAWRTIGKVNGEAFLPGDRIELVRGGEWRERLTAPSSGAPNSRITFGAYGVGDNPIVNGSDLVVTWSDEGGNVWSAALATDPSQVFFDDVKGTQEAILGNLNAAREWFWNANVLYVYSVADPDTAYTSPGIEASVRAAAFRALNKDYIRFENLHVTKAMTQNIVISDGDYHRLVNLESDYSSTDGLSLDNCDYCQVVGGRYHHNGTLGTDPDFASDTGTGILIWNGSQDNIVDGIEGDVNVEDGVTLGGPVGFWTGPDNIVRNCDLHNNLEDGIDIKNAVQSIINNTVYDNAHYGLFVHNTAGIVTNIGNTYTDNALCNLIVQDTGGPVRSYGNRYKYTGAPSNQNANVWVSVARDNHTFYYDIFVGGDLRQLQFQVANNNVVYNCAFYNPNDGTNGLLRFIGDSDNNTVKNCAFYGNGYQLLRFEAGSVVTASDYNSFYRSDSINDWEYVNDTSYDQSDIDDGTIFVDKGLEEHSITGDPLWTAPGSDDFTLQAGSGLRDAGIDVGLSEDFAGVSVPQEVNPAIGALEYVP